MTNILIVDDSKTIRMAIRRILESLGVEADEAENGQVCIDKVKASTYDAILLDWNMPVMNGYDCLQALRADPANENLRIVMVTTKNSLDEISQALGAGVNEYVMKPFDKDILQEKLIQVGVSI